MPEEQTPPRQQQPPEANAGAMAALSQAGTALSRGAYQAAHEACLRALRLEPGSPQAYYLLGVIAAAHGNHPKAITLYRRALDRAPNRADVLAACARSCIATNQRAMALRYVSQAAALTPTDPVVQDTLGVVLSRAGLHAQAVPWYECATALKPENGAFQYNLGAALQFLGEMKKARLAYRRCIAINPMDTRAYAGLVQITKQTVDDNCVPELEAVFAALAPDDADGRLRIGHALAKAGEDMGDQVGAMTWLGLAKAVKRQHRAYDRRAADDLFAAAAATAERHSGRAGHATTHPPIFVVGMPRTGTTLVERILSSHSAIGSAGELSDFSLILKRRARTSSPLVLDRETLEGAGALDLAAVGEAYMDGVAESLGLTGRFVDKMPLNAFYAALILQALPDARVICLRRSPADTILSNYRQLFATSFTYYDYSFDLEDTAHYYLGFTRMIETFSSLLPADRFMTCAYEDLVTDLDGVARALLAFCDAPFEPACLAFHENTAPVATASAAQVRVPVYASSIGRWRACEAEIAPALAVLSQAGVAP